MKTMQDSYCRKQTKKRLIQIFPALIFFFIAAACGVLFASLLRADKTGWEYTDYFKLAVSAVIAAAGLILGLYEIYTGMRDALFPANSRLAKSIRAQLPGPDADLGVEELFGIVDRDLNEHGIWFSGARAAVGHEWVLGDDAVYIPRIRVACGRDEISRSNGGSRSSRVVAFYLLDDRKKPHSKVLYNPNELKAFLDCLKLRAPDVFFCSYQEYLSYRAKSDIEWEEVLQGFRHRKNEREIKKWGNE